MNDKELRNPISILSDQKEIDEKVKLLERAIIGDMEENKPKKSSEEKMYLVYYYADDPDSNSLEKIKSFEELKGRTAVYEFIKGMIDYIDIHESKVLVETLTLDKAITVYEFMVGVSQFYPDDTFDIEDYNIGDVGEDEFEEE